MSVHIRFSIFGIDLPTYCRVKGLNEPLTIKDIDAYNRESAKIKAIKEAAAFMYAKWEDPIFFSYKAGHVEKEMHHCYCSGLWYPDPNNTYLALREEIKWKLTTRQFEDIDIGKSEFWWEEIKGPENQRHIIVETGEGGKILVSVLDTGEDVTFKLRDYGINNGEMAYALTTLLWNLRDPKVDPQELDVSEFASGGLGKTKLKIESSPDLERMRRGEKVPIQDIMMKRKHCESIYEGTIDSCFSISKMATVDIEYAKNNPSDCISLLHPEMCFIPYSYTYMGREHLRLIIELSKREDIGHHFQKLLKNKNFLEDSKFMKNLPMQEREEIVKGEILGEFGLHMDIYLAIEKCLHDDIFVNESRDYMVEEGIKGYSLLELMEEVNINYVANIDTTEYGTHLYYGSGSILSVLGLDINEPKSLGGVSIVEAAPIPYIGERNSQPGYISRDSMQDMIHCMVMKISVNMVKHNIREACDRCHIPTFVTLFMRRRSLCDNGCAICVSCYRECYEIIENDVIWRKMCPICKPETIGMVVS